jgi:4-amino-4-deoxy-L-arabinose transferase-like glycosyltransferase
MTNAWKWELGIVVGLALASAVTAASLARWAPVGLTGRYWTVPDWRGRPAVEAAGAVPSLDDVRGRLPGAGGSFSAEWSGYLVVPSGGTHRFALLSDDGSWLDIDFATVVDNGGTHSAQEVAASIALDAGVHHVKVRFFQGEGNTAFRLAWTEPGLAPRRLTIFDVAPDRASARRQLDHGHITRALAVGVAVCWALLFLYLPVRLGCWLTWREVRRLAPEAGDRRNLRIVLAAGVALTAWGIWFGLGQPWVPDELPTSLVQLAYECQFSHGFHDKYPLMHLAVLAVPWSAFEIAGRLSILPVDGQVSEIAQMALFRLVSLLSGVGTLAVAYLCGAELYGPRRGVAAPIVLLLTPLFLYYGKNANLDLPSLFWFGWAMLGFVRAIKFNRAGDYVLLGAAAAAAVATKDQHYANLVLVPLGVLIVSAGRQQGQARLARLGRALADSRLWLGGTAAVVASVVLHNAVFNYAGFVGHVRELASYRHVLPLVPATAGGYLALVGRTGEAFAFGMGWAWFAAAVFGILLAARCRERRWWLWLLLVPLSFYLSFTLVARSVYDRYLFGGVFVLALFGGAALSELHEARRWRPCARLVTASLVACSLLYAVSINLMMVRDARYEARRWMLHNVPGGTKVGMLGGSSYLPAFGGRFRTIDVNPRVEDLARIDPDLLVVNARLANRYEALPEGRALLRRIEDGSLGYREVFRRRTPMPAWALLQYTAPFRGGRESELTNLDKVNPEVVIYRKAGPPPVP